MNWLKRHPNLFSEFATKSLAEAVKLALSAGVAVVTTSSPAGAIIGEGAKALVESLLKTASQIEGKIDLLLKEPLRSGIKFLQEGITHPCRTAEESKGRQDLLHDAHVSLTRAAAFVGDSREDFVFVLALDSLALAAHGAHKDLAARSIAKGNLDLNDLRTHVEAMELESTEMVNDSNAVDKFLDRDSLRDRPYGFMEQRLIARRLRKQALAAQEKTRQERDRFDILEGLFKLAEHVNTDRSTNESAAR